MYKYKRVLTATLEYIGVLHTGVAGRHLAQIMVAIQCLVPPQRLHIRHSVVGWSDIMRLIYLKFDWEIHTCDYQGHFAGYLIEVTHSGVAAFLGYVRFVDVGSYPGEMKTLWCCELSIYESYSSKFTFIFTNTRLWGTWTAATVAAI